MYHSETVEVSHVEESIRLMKVATQQAATDPRTGEIDMGVITTGASEEERRHTEALAKEIMDVIQAMRGRTCHVKKVLKKFNSKAGSDKQISLSQLKKVITLLSEEEQIRCGEWTHDDPIITKLT